MRALPLALVAVAALALPAAADVSPTPPPDCVTFLANALAGTSRGCATLGTSPAVAGGTATRDLFLVVAAGSAKATLTCGGLTDSATVELGKPGAGGDYVEGGGNCWVTVTALTDGTTAVASNTTGYVFK